MIKHLFFYFNLLLAVCFLCLSGKGILLAAESRQKIAVMDFKTVNTTADLGEGAAEILRTTLIQTGKYIVVERSMLQEALKEQKLGLGGAVDQNTAIGIGKVLGAQLVAVGSVVKMGGTYTLNVRFVDVETGEVVLGKNLTASNEEELPGLCGDMVKVLTRKESVQKQEEETPTQPISDPLKTQAPKIVSAGPKIKAHPIPGVEHWALGAVYPGGALKYISNNHAWELKAQTGSGVLAAGPRYYRYITNSGLRLFWGLEADYISFKSEESKGTGFAGGGFVGGEIPLGDKLGLALDFGPMYIRLAETTYSQSASSMEYVLNMAIFWHFR